MTFTPDQLNQVASKERGNPIRSNDWNIVVNEVQNLGEQVQEVSDFAVNRNGDTIAAPLIVESAESPLLAVGQAETRATLNVLPNGRVGVGTTSPRDTVAIRAQNRQQSLMSFEDPNGRTRWHLEQNHNGDRPGLNFVETGVADGRLFIGAGGNVGINTTTPSNPLHVVGSSSGTRTADHIAYISNTGAGTVGVLALQVTARGDLDTTENFITFFNGRGQSVGAVEGSRDGAIRLSTSSADYAEYLPRLNPEEIIDAGDVVGVIGNKVTRRTEGAQRIMAVTDRPIVLGNRPDEDQKHLYEQISFIGQVPIKVRGSVQVGDYIVPSRLNDGMGIAITPEQMTLAHCGQIVGQAWESSDEVGVKRVNAAVGLDWSGVVAGIFATEVAGLKAEIAALKEAQAMAIV
ncbi:MAG: hypothetical protein ACFBSF_08315 [Leptolyngbyaceae cyanobacterium]